MVGGLANEIGINQLISLVTTDNDKNVDTRYIDLKKLKGLVVEYTSFNLGQDMSGEMMKEQISKYLLIGFDQYLKSNDGIPWEVESRVVVAKQANDMQYHLRYEGELVRVQPDNHPKGLE